MGMDVNAYKLGDVECRKAGADGNQGQALCNGVMGPCSGENIWLLHKVSSLHKVVDL
jgi:hypothetical protein